MARILIVEDVKFISKVLASVFEERGHVVEVAADGEQALEMARKNLPELILSDISMPRMDGLEVARRLKSDAQTAIVPILIVTSRTDAEAMAEANEAGVDGYVCKPFETKDLLARAKRLLGGFPMNYAVSCWDRVTVLRALSSELTDETAGHLSPAVEAARAANEGALIVLDFSRVRRVETGCLDAVLAAVRSAAGGKPVVGVEPGEGMGVHALHDRLEAYAQWYPDLPVALRTVGVSATATERPVRLGAPSHGVTAKA